MHLFDIIGKNVTVKFLLDGNKIVAYSWHYTERKAMEHLKRIMEYHSLHGKISYSKELELWLVKNLRKVLFNGEVFILPKVEYRNKRLYEELLKIKHGETITYSELSRRANIKYTEMLVALMRNPLQVLIPCHRLLTKKGTLMGFYPLGKEVKRRLLDLERREHDKMGNPTKFSI